MSNGVEGTKKAELCAQHARDTAYLIRHGGHQAG